jgi:hypothetical protein
MCFLKMLVATPNVLALYKAFLRPTWTSLKREDIFPMEQYFEHLIFLPITSYPAVLSQEILSWYMRTAASTWSLQSSER